MNAIPIPALPAAANGEDTLVIFHCAEFDVAHKVKGKVAKSLTGNGLSSWEEFSYYTICCSFQQTSPRAQDCQCNQEDQEEDQDRLRPNVKPEPDNIRLMNQIKAVGVNAHRADDFGQRRSPRNQPCQA